MPYSISYIFQTTHLFTKTNKYSKKLVLYLYPSKFLIKNINFSYGNKSNKKQDILPRPQNFHENIPYYNAR